MPLNWLSSDSKASTISWWTCDTVKLACDGGPRRCPFLQLAKAAWEQQKMDSLVPAGLSTEIGVVFICPSGESQPQWILIPGHVTFPVKGVSSLNMLECLVLSWNEMANCSLQLCLDCRLLISMRYPFFFERKVSNNVQLPVVESVICRWPMRSCIAPNAATDVSGFVQTALQWAMSGFTSFTTKMGSFLSIALLASSSKAAESAQILGLSAEKWGIDLLREVWIYVAKVRKIQAASRSQVIPLLSGSTSYIEAWWVSHHARACFIVW